MPISDNEELGVNLHARPFSDSVSGVPIKKRRSMLVQPLSPPADCDVPQKSSEPESSISEIGNQPVSVTALTNKGSSESRVESIVCRDLNMTPDQEILPLFDHQWMRPNMADKRTNNVKESTPCNKHAIWPVMGSTQQLPAKEVSGKGKLISSDTSPFSGVSGSTEFQLAFNEHSGLPEKGENSEGCSGKQGKLFSCSWNLALGEREQNLQSKRSDVESQADPTSLCLSRSNWDLNTTMDTWEGLFSDSAANNETHNHGMSDLGGINPKRIGSGPGQILYKEPDGADETLGKRMLQKRERNLKSSNPLTSMNEGNNAEDYLDLQLKPSFIAESFFNWGSTCHLGKLDSIKEMPILSLSVKPSSSCNPILPDCRAVKVEPREERSQKDARNTEVGGTKSPALKHVKFEPCEVQEPPKRVDSGDLKSTCRIAVKSEPLEIQSQGYLKTLDNCSLAPQSTETPPNVSEHVHKDMESPVPDGNIKHGGPQMTTANITQDPGQRVGKALELVTQVPTPHSNETRDSRTLHISTGIPQYGKEIICKTSDLVEKSLFSEGKDLNLVMEEHKMAGLASELPSLSLHCDDTEHMVADGMSEVVAQLSCEDGHNLTGVTSADELRIDSYGKGNVAESSEGKIDISAEVLDKACDREKESNSSQDTVGAIVTVQNQLDDGYEDGEVLDKHCNSEKELTTSHDAVGALVTVHNQFDDGYEDGEVRYRALHNTTVGSCEKREDNMLKDADSICPVDIHAEVTSCLDLKEDKIENSVELKIQGTVNCDGVQCSDDNNPGISSVPNLHEPSADGVLNAGCKNDPGISTKLNSHESSADGVLNAGSGKMRPRKNFKSPRDHLKDKGPERKPKSDIALGARESTEGSHGVVSSQQENVLAKFSGSSKPELSIKVEAEEHGNDRSKGNRIIYLNPGPNGLESGKTPFIPGRSLSSRIGRKKLAEKSLRRDKFRPRRFRDEYCNQGSLTFGTEGKDQPVGRRGAELMHFRRRANNQINALHGDRNPDHEHLMEQADSSNAARFPRPINASEIAIAAGSDGYNGNPGRLARKLADDELQTFSHMPCRRRSPPGARGRLPVGMQTVRHPIRDRYMGRDVPDFVLQDHEMRILPDDMMVPPLFPSPRSQFERAEGSLIRRERRSISPVQRRGRLHIPPIYAGSSPRSPRSHHQWSPPRRTPDGFDGPPELMGCRSPNVMPHRMRSPHQRLCFAEDMIVRRRGSPPYHVRLPDDVADIDPSQEHDFPRPLRGMQRNMRRFDSNDPREVSEEEYFEPLLHNQFGELAVDPECFVDRNCDERHERRVLSRPFRQRRNVGDGDDESFRSHVDSGAPRPIRFCPEGNAGFPGRGNRRDFDGHIRNRLGSPSSRLRVIEEQEDNYRFPNEPGWCDAGFNDPRLKRRRFERP